MLSLLEVRSRSAACTVACTKIVQGGEDISTLSATDPGGRSGTTVTVRNLFYNCPVRRSVAHGRGRHVEIARARDALQELALAHPNVAFNLVDDEKGRAVWRCQRAADLPTRARDLFGAPIIDRMRAVTHVSASAFGTFRIDGLLSLGLDAGDDVAHGFHSNRDLQYLFVNNRAVPRQGELPKLLNNVVLRGLTNETMAKAHSGTPRASKLDIAPLFILRVTCPPSAVDHLYEPDKRPLQSFGDPHAARRCLLQLLQSFVHQSAFERRGVARVIKAELARLTDDAPKPFEIETGVGHKRPLITEDVHPDYTSPGSPSTPVSERALDLEFASSCSDRRWRTSLATSKLASRPSDGRSTAESATTAADSAAAFENACYGWGHHGHKNGGNSKEENARLRNEDDHSQQRRSKASGATVDHSNFRHEQDEAAAGSNSGGICMARHAAASIVFDELFFGPAVSPQESATVGYEKGKVPGLRQTEDSRPYDDGEAGWGSDPGDSLHLCRSEENRFARDADSILSIVAPATTWHNLHALSPTANVTRELLRTALVVSQVDSKYVIACTGSILICLDQHAADERVRLEALEKKVYGSCRTQQNTTKSCFVPPANMRASAHEVTLLQMYSELLERWNWRWHVLEPVTHATNISILEAPEVLGVKLSPEDLRSLLHQLEELDPSAAGIDVKPKIVQYVLNSKACRSAIMFGDTLSHEQCSVLLTDLSRCQLPFQCAHGRPSAVVLLDDLQQLRTRGSFKQVDKVPRHSDRTPAAADIRSAGDSRRAHTVIGKAEQRRLLAKQDPQLRGIWRHQRAVKSSAEAFSSTRLEHEPAQGRCLHRCKAEIKGFLTV
mmetsp:Transcript_68047/g.188323  ORF Transcript_68047/g.188323 Transcript_68047/m.188323 type:complete len:841 (-) Transcript_68047:314-2836(-)